MAINCSETGAERLWSSTNTCGDLPLAIVLLIADVLGWGLLLIIGYVRLVYNKRAATANVMVSKALQFLQMWFYSMWHTIIGLLALFSFGDLLEKGEPIPAFIILFFYVLSIAIVSQIDVVATSNKRPGINDIDLTIMLQYMFTTYLPKAVWKMSGTKEVDWKETDAPAGRMVDEGQDMEKKGVDFLCLADLSDNKMPAVYDVKDVVGIQGAVLGIPTLFMVLFTIVRSVGVNDATNEEENFTELTELAAMFGFLSSIFGALFGDWEKYSKDIKKVLFSGVFRFVELVARIGFYVFFLDFTKLGGFLLLAGEFTYMWCTSQREREISREARTAALSHKVLSSWESIFFINYQRLSVDKDLTVTGNGFKPAVEMSRFLVRSLVTVVGYITMGASQLPEEYLEVLDSFFWIGLGANVLVLLSGTVYFFVFNKKEIKRSDLSPTVGYCCSFPPMSIFQARTINVNRDVPHYIL